MKELDEKQDLTVGNLLRKLIVFALPLILSGLIQLFFTTTDLFVVGQFGNGNTSLGAIGANGALVHLLVGSGTCVSAGFNIVIGNAIGANDHLKVKKTLQTGFIVALIIGIFRGSLTFIFAEKLLEITNVDPLVFDQAVVYLKVYCLGAPFMVLYNFIAAALRGFGDSKTPLYILSFSGILNFIFNCIFVIGFDLDVLGVALGTVLSQIFAVIAALYYLGYGKRTPVKFRLKESKFFFDETKEILILGETASIQAILFSLSNTIIQSEINKYGAIYMAGSTAAANLDLYLYTAMNFLSVALMAVVSQNYGARQFERVKKSLVYAILIETIMGIVVGAFLIIFRYPLLKILVTESEELPMDQVLNAGSERMIIVTSIYFTCGIMDCLSSYFRGLKYSLTPTIVSLCGSVVIRIVFIFTLYQLPQFHSFMWLLVSWPVSWVITIAIYLILFPSYTSKAFNKLVPTRSGEGIN